MVTPLPGIGEQSMPSRVRLGIALMLPATLLPAHQKAYTVDLNSLGPVILLLFEEIVVGAVLWASRLVWRYRHSRSRGP